MEKNKKGFKWRGFATFLLALGMLIEIVSGVVLYVTPLGRFANWNNWTLMGLDKHAWGAVHTVFGFLLLIIIMLHLYFNWKVIVHFVWNKLHSTFNLKWELALSLLLVAGIFAGTLWNIPPFSTVMNIGADAKLSWEKNSSGTVTRGGRWAQSDYDGHEGTIGTMRGGGNWALSNAISGPDSSFSTQKIEGKWGRDKQNSQAHEQAYETRGGGRGRNALQEGGNYYQQGNKGNQNVPAENLKGRDYVRLGERGDLSGILVKEGSEWGLRVGDKLYEIHMGPSDHLAEKGLVLQDGAKADVSGFISGTDVAVTSITTNGKSLTLRDETGRPSWSGTKFSRGANRLSL